MGNSTFFNRGSGATENESDFQEHSMLVTAPAKPAAGLIRTYMDASGVHNLLDAAGATLKAITGTQANVDDAVTKKHTAGTDQGLDTGGANAVTAADVKLAVTAKHSNTADHAQGTDTGLDTGGTNPVSAATIKGVTDLVAPGAGANSVIVGTGGAGHLNTAAGTCNIVGGNDNTAAGNNNLVVGEDHATVAGNDNIVAGKANSVSGATSHYNDISGESNTVTGSHNLVSGKSSSVTGDHNAVAGDTHSVVGSTNTVVGLGHTVATLNNCFVQGKEAAPFGSYQHAIAAGKFAGGVPGSAQYESFVVKGITTDATPVNLLLDGAAIALWWRPAMYAVKATIVCTDVDCEAVGAFYALAALVQSNLDSAVVSLLGSVSKTVVHESSAGFDADITVGDVTNTLKITVTGAVATTLRWVAFVEMVQVSFAAP